MVGESRGLITGSREQRASRREQGEESGEQENERKTGEAGRRGQRSGIRQERTASRDHGAWSREQGDGCVTVQVIFRTVVEETGEACLTGGWVQLAQLPSKL